MPKWVILIIVLSAMGPMMRMIFGGRDSAPRRLRPGKRRDADDVARLEGAIAERDVVIEDLQQRLSELESRLDFTERMLLKPREASGQQAGV